MSSGLGMLSKPVANQAGLSEPVAHVPALVSPFSP